MSEPRQHRVATGGRMGASNRSRLRSLVLLVLLGVGIARVARCSLLALVLELLVLLVARCWCCFARTRSFSGAFRSSGCPAGWVLVLLMLLVAGVVLLAPEAFREPSAHPVALQADAPQVGHVPQLLRDAAGQLYVCGRCVCVAGVQARQVSGVCVCAAGQLCVWQVRLWVLHQCGSEGGSGDFLSCEAPQKVMAGEHSAASWWVWDSVVAARGRAAARQGTHYRGRSGGASALHPDRLALLHPRSSSSSSSAQPHACPSNARKCHPQSCPPL